MAVLVGKRAPSFKVTAIVNGESEDDFSLDRYLGKKHVVFFFYSADFAAVCPTEILAFQDRLADFEAKGVAIVGCSTDTRFSHLAWLRVSRENGGIAGVTYPLVADASKTIAANYDVLGGRYDYSETGEMVFIGLPMAQRGLFLIDKDGIVRHQVVNDGPLRRSVEEAMRMVDALQDFELNGEVSPASRQEDKQVLPASRNSLDTYLGKQY